jgi:hypothetical protein
VLEIAVNDVVGREANVRAVMGPIVPGGVGVTVHTKSVTRVRVEVGSRLSEWLMVRHKKRREKALIHSTYEKAPKRAAFSGSKSVDQTRSGRADDFSTAADMCIEKLRRPGSKRVRQGDGTRGGLG